MEDILHFLPDVFNRVEVRGIKRPINGLNSILLQLCFNFSRGMNRSIVLLKKRFQEYTLGVDLPRDTSNNSKKYNYSS